MFRMLEGQLCKHGVRLQAWCHRRGACHPDYNKFVWSSDRFSLLTDIFASNRHRRALQERGLPYRLTRKLQRSSSRANTLEMETMVPVQMLLLSLGRGASSLEIASRAGNAKSGSLQAAKWLVCAGTESKPKEGSVSEKKLEML